MSYHTSGEREEHSKGEGSQHGSTNYAKYSQSSLQDPGQILHHEDHPIPDDPEHDSEDLGDDSLLLLSEGDITPTSDEVLETHRSQGVEATADCAEGPAEHPGHEEARHPGNVAHHLQYEYRDKYRKLYYWENVVRRYLHHE